MKKLLILTMIAGIMIFSGCKKVEKDNNLPTIAIVKLISHNSLDDAEKGIMDELKAQNVKANIINQNASGEINNTMSIANKLKNDKVDIAVGIATPVLVALANVLDNTPIVFTAVTDPVSAGVAVSPTKGKKNITGVTDAIPIKEQLEEFKKFYNFKKLGVIYTASESNSVSMIETTKKACKELGIELIVKTITHTSDLKAAAESLAGRVDAFYCFTDNSIATAMPSLTETAKKHKIPVFGGDITPTLNGGVVYALGFSYYEMGRIAGKQIIEILNGKKPDDMPILSLNDPKYYNILIDLDSAKNLNINVDKSLLDKAKYIIKDKKLIEK